MFSFDTISRISPPHHNSFIRTVFTHSFNKHLQSSSDVPESTISFGDVMEKQGLVLEATKQSHRCLINHNSKGHKGSTCVS